MPRKHIQLEEVVYGVGDDDSHVVEFVRTDPR